MKKRTFWLWVAALTLMRLALAWGQQGYTWVGGAPLDDELMFRAAQSISRCAGFSHCTHDLLWRKLCVRRHALLRINPHPCPLMSQG